MAAILMMILLMFSYLPLFAKNLGVVGQTFPIAEQDMAEIIQSKLKEMEKSGELQRHQDHLKSIALQAIQQPRPVKGITRATETRVFYHDPSFSYPHDLKDHQGKVFYRAGTRINPLSYQPYTRELIFIDGDDVRQKSWCWDHLQQSQASEKIKIILIKGLPLKLSEEWKCDIYFAQGGVLTKTLKIEHVPAIVKQEGMKLKITELKIEEKEGVCAASH